MNNVIVGLKRGEKIKLENVDFQELIENLNNSNLKNAVFITFDDIMFVIQNIEYIRKDK